MKKTILFIVLLISSISLYAQNSNEPKEEKIKYYMFLNDVGNEVIVKWGNGKKSRWLKDENDNKITELEQAINLFSKQGWKLFQLVFESYSQQACIYKEMTPQEIKAFEEEHQNEK